MCIRDRGIEGCTTTEEMQERMKEVMPNVISLKSKQTEVVENKEELEEELESLVMKKFKLKKLGDNVDESLGDEEGLTIEGLKEAMIERDEADKNGESVDEETAKRMARDADVAFAELEGMSKNVPNQGAGEEEGGETAGAGAAPAKGEKGAKDKKKRQK
eukprot:TRINITY_DN25083_c0_g2_i1.p1 TRINITY_DN25083_c0_g2~~TRINITY_DN25083_c0_g2_i1.p1  ORF type:complete len:180 (+),score=79.82 TRINITY_DN25083_c0_g2_i1:61-540(+)